jgi:CspA family cold shock protein
MESGKVKFFGSGKGFGFITPDAGGAELFFHITELEKSGINTLEENQRVSFERKQDPLSGNWSAANIRLA